MGLRTGSLLEPASELSHGVVVNVIVFAFGTGLTNLSSRASALIETQADKTPTTAKTPNEIRAFFQNEILLMCDNVSIDTLAFQSRRFHGDTKEIHASPSIFATASSAAALLVFVIAFAFYLASLYRQHRQGVCEARDQFVPTRIYSDVSKIAPPMLRTHRDRKATIAQLHLQIKRFRPFVHLAFHRLSLVSGSRQRPHFRDRKPTHHASLR